MNRNELKRKALSMCLIVATIATYSMVTLAASDEVTGQLLVNGKTINGSTGVTVNGEAAPSGLTIFSSSTITTLENVSAAVSLGKIGTIKVDPKSTLALSFNKNGITGELLSGTVTVLNAENNVAIKLANGKMVNLGVGESASTENAKAQDDDDDNDGGSAWWIWAAVFGGAIVGIVIAATSDNNRLALGGGTTVISPAR